MILLNGCALAEINSNLSSNSDINSSNGTFEIIDAYFSNSNDQTVSKI